MPFRNLQAFHCISGVCFRRLYFVLGVLPNPLFRDILNNGIALYMIINNYYYNRDSKNCKENRKDPKRKRLEEGIKIMTEKTENNKSIETDEKNSTTIEGKKTSLDDLSPKSKKSVKIYNAVRFLVLIAAGVTLIYASYSLTESYLNYKDDEKKYASLNDMFVQDANGNSSSDGSTGSDGNSVANNSTNSDNSSTASNSNTASSTAGSNNTSSSNSGSLSYSADSKKWVWDYDAMLKYNDEAKGYIKLDGTRIQYPIFEHSDNKYYLKHGADKIYNGAGAIFIDYRTAGLEGDMCILYGHNMLDGSMFKEIMNFRDKDFCKKHPTFDIYIGRKHYIYYVFSVFSGKDVDEKIYQYGFENKSDFQSWIDRVYSKSTYKFDTRKPTTDDKIIMCSTCVDDYGNRQLVCMYRGQEVVD